MAANMRDTFVKLKTIADLQNESAIFFIDAYQRGYRWTENEVRDLLDDIREFSHVKRQDDGTFYCLQPIIVTRADDGVSWKVIDGQQRLTTIYLIMGRIDPVECIGVSQQRNGNVLNVKPPAMRVRDDCYTKITFPL